MGPAQSLARGLVPKAPGAGYSLSGKHYESFPALGVRTSPVATWRA
jgi:hypothetical protein